MRPVQAGIELERRKALPVIVGQTPTFMAQRFQRLSFSKHGIQATRWLPGLRSRRVHAVENEELHSP